MDVYVVVALPFTNNHGNATPLLAGDPLSSWSYFAHPSHGLKYSVWLLGNFPWPEIIVFGC